MPASESHHLHRNSSPITEASYRGPNNAVAESGSRRQSRKRGKNALQKETNTANDAETTVAGEVGRNSPPMRADDVNGTSPRRSPIRNSFAPSNVLDALNSAEKVADQDASNLMGAWAQSIPFSKSPPLDLLEGMTVGVSPPSFETATDRGGFSRKTPPSSPPEHKSRPVSYGAGMYPPQVRQSLSEKSLRIPQQPFVASSQPLPHLPQAHFYGLPDIDLGAGNRFREARSDGPERFLSFAELPSAGSQKRQKNRSDVILLGSEDRLDVIALETDKLAAYGALEGVGGTIFDAKVLTWDSGNDPFHEIRPLVALVVHGPRRQEHKLALTSDLTSDQDSIPVGTPATAGPLPARTNGHTDFQTTVEVYSLSSQEHLITLLWSQPSPGLPNIRGLPVSVPPPVGNLKLDARGKFLTVSSGVSGETFIFMADSDSAKIRCIGKVWTSIQVLHDRRYSNSSNSTDPDVSPADVNRGGKFTPLPIMSLSSRWLAIVPPGPIASLSIPITVDPRSTQTIVPGIESRNAPPQPPVTCVLESPDAESLINRVVRGVAQEVVKGARWLGGQGLQTWNNYWNKDQHTVVQGPAQNRNIYQGDTHLPPGIFPPTHAPESRPASAEAQLVSIIDLCVLARESYASNSDTVTSLATFQPPGGVSFLSFSPDGLSIISATRKGDIQYVWDLKQSRHLRAGTLLANPDSDSSTRSPMVTQLARFARLTPSSIVDIEWRGPSGDRFAVITKNGTIHVFDIPLAAFQWPAPRRLLRPVPSSAPASPAVIAQPDEPTTAGTVFSTAMKLAGRTQPMFSTLRGRAPSVGMSNAVGSGNNTIGFASATGIRGSKVVAAGLSRSVGAATGTVSSLRHAGDNRLHLNNLAMNPARSRICWSQHGEQCSLVVIDGQCIKSYRVSRRRASSKPGRQALSVINSHPSVSLALPASEQLSALRSDNTTTEGFPAGYWALPQPYRPTAPPPIPRGITHPLSFAEIETNAPYQPFHSDRRVNLFIYNSNNKSGGYTTTDMDEPWTFGNPIFTTKVDIRPPTSVSDDEEEEQNRNNGASVLYRHTSTTTTAGLGEALIGGGEEEDGGLMAEQVVVTTTRRRKTKTPHQSKMLAAGEDDGEGFFEDDCDVLDFAEDRV